MNKGLNHSRRQFLKVGLLGSATLSLAACSSVVSRKADVCRDCEFLRTDERPMLTVIIPVMLAGALPQDSREKKKAIVEIIQGFDFTVAHLPGVVREEIHQLLWVLQFPVTRALVAGVWGSWQNTSEDNVRLLLDNWKNSDFDLLRVGYAALHDLIMGAWYSNPASWQQIHYPGPPILT